MRVSSNSNDPGYVQFCKDKNIKVFLDGEEVKCCTVADEELGFVDRFVLDEKGLVQVDPTDPSIAWTERVNGVVEIKSK